MVNLLKKNVIFSCLVLVLLFISPASAGLKVTGMIYNGELAAGEGTSHVMEISIKEGDSPIDIAVDVMGFGQSPEMSSCFLEASEDKNPYSAREFISIDRPTFHLEPGESEIVTASIHVPEDAEGAAMYALINVHNKPAGDGTVAFCTAFAVPVVITIPDRARIQTGNISNINVEEAVAGQPMLISTKFENTGNYHYHVLNEISIEDLEGRTVTMASNGLSASSIVPTNSANFKIEIKDPLPVGKYQLHSTMKLEDGTVLDEKNTVFEVEKEYIPPFKEVSVRVLPGEPAVLATEKGRCELSFPPGAVVSGVKITLKPGNLEQLPGVPEGYEPGVTCISIEGLQGLLAKEARLLVEYNKEDLDAAGGDTSKLSLAYWDSGLSQWVPVSTELDEGNMKLKVHTNRLGTWAVLVGDSMRDMRESGASEKGSKSVPLGGMIPALSLLTAGLLSGRKGNKKRK